MGRLMDPAVPSAGNAGALPEGRGRSEKPATPPNVESAAVPGAVNLGGDVALDAGFDTVGVLEDEFGRISSSANRLAIALESFCCLPYSVSLVEGRSLSTCRP